MVIKLRNEAKPNAMKPETEPAMSDKNGNTSRTARIGPPTMSIPTNMSNQPKNRKTQVIALFEDASAAKSSLAD